MNKEDFLAGKPFKVLLNSNVRYRYNNGVIEFTPGNSTFAIEKITDTLCTAITNTGPVDIHFTKCILINE